jgi:hypothetical protein
MNKNLISRPDYPLRELTGSIGATNAGRDVDLSGRRDKGDDLDAVGDLQVFLGNGTSSDTPNGLTGGRASSSGRSLDTILLEVGVVGVRGTRVEVGLGVVVGALVLVADLERDWCAKGDTVLNTRVDDYKILLVAGGGQVRLAGAAASKLGLDVSLDELHALNINCISLCCKRQVECGLQGGHRRRCSRQTGSGIHRRW